jgi:hypothetical protein
LPGCGRKTENTENVVHISGGATHTHTHVKLTVIGDSQGMRNLQRRLYRKLHHNTAPITTPIGTTKTQSKQPRPNRGTPEPAGSTLHNQMLELSWTKLQQAL